MSVIVRRETSRGSYKCDKGNGEGGVWDHYGTIKEYEFGEIDGVRDYENWAFATLSFKVNNMYKFHILCMCGTILISFNFKF